jgi:alpha-methylacyl-CoA racemase
MAAYGVYRCADGRHVAVGALEPPFFAALCAALDEPSFEEMHLDPARQDELGARLAEIFAGRPRDEWVELLGGVDACVTPVLDLAEAMTASPVVRDAALRDGTPMRQTGLPVTWSDADREEPGPAPGLGEHTADVLAELGYDAARVDDLRRRNAV